VQQTYRRDRMVGDRSGRPIAIAIIDIDHFKSINDKHGHATGDKVLQLTASTIARSLRLSDVVARWGGEEFVVILPDADAAGAVRAIEHALAAVRQLQLSGPDGETFGVTFSAGVVVTRTGEALDLAVHRADAALYDAKRSGRDRVLTARRRTGVITAAIPLAQGTERLPGCGTVVRDANQEPGVRRTGRGRVQRQLDEPKTGTDS
jgi:diguanylate cyclase (GGDEF)-like protein